MVADLWRPLALLIFGFGSARFGATHVDKSGVPRGFLRTTAGTLGMDPGWTSSGTSAIPAASACTLPLVSAIA
uniref:Putative secreted protein n=1 Tax=Anopheles darlingi TaxID=43151 RepID=A0A2M4DR48_ANODA